MMSAVVAAIHAMAALMTGLRTGPTTRAVVSAKLSNEAPAVAAGDHDGLEWKSGTKLPTLEDLQDTCHMVADGSAYNLFLCLTPPSGDSDCQHSENFSAHYGQPVYLCPGGWALPPM